jgi:Nuclease-related domain
VRGAGCSAPGDGPIGEASARQAPIRLDHETRCQSCGERLVAGDLAKIGPVSDTIVCLACAARPDGEAGASAQREYERRRRTRRDHARETLGLVGTVLARVIEEPQSTQSWAQGARGERRTAVRLEQHHAGHPVKLLHDRRIPGHRNANLDHLAVGPGGVTVIDTKTHRGEVRVERVGGLFTDRHSILKIGGRDQTKLIDGVERQVKLVAAALTAPGSVIWTSAERFASRIPTGCRCARSASAAS